LDLKYQSSWGSKLLTKVNDCIWLAEQPFQYFGLSVGNRMTIVRLNGNDLAVISPIKIDSIDSSVIDEINNLGRVSYIIAPNLFHHLFIRDFQNIYPNAKLWAIAGLELKRPDLKIDYTFFEREGNVEEQLDYLYFEGFQTIYLNGFAALNEYVFYHRASQTLILTDTAFYFDASCDPIVRLAAKLLGSYQKLRPLQLEQIATRDRQSVQQAIERVLEWDFNRIIVAHGSIVETNAKQQLKEGYEWFLNTKLG
jgi:hypothetical protein